MAIQDILERKETLLNTNDMNDLEKAREIADGYSTDSQGMMPIRMVKQEIKQSCLEMARWKDEQLESKLMQIIILAQQGYTSGATDEMILKHCKEIINENYEHNTTKTD